MISLTESSIIQNFRKVEQCIRTCEHRLNIPLHKVQLVAVSKTKSESDILELYNIGHRHFGENYVQELLSKAANLPNDINWHFIGHLQSQKAKQLIEQVPNLYVLETIDSIKLAKKLNNALINLNRPNNLKVYIQVDTSLEPTKSGVLPSELNELVNQIITECPKLTIEGLMTIGAPGDFTCFDKLVECRSSVSQLLGLEENDLILSMGMSDDFEVAIEKGSSSVRVGSLIFGHRN